MGEMNRATAGHGQSTAPIGGGKSRGRLGHMLNGIAGAMSDNAAHENAARMQAAQHEHDFNMAVTKHVLAKDMHSHVYKGSEGGTGISMDYEGIKTSSTKKARKPRQTSFTEGTTPAEQETPAAAPEAPATPEAPASTNHTAFIGATIPSNPGEWKGGFVQRNPETGKTEAIPAYKEFKTRKQHFQEATQAQAEAQKNTHFAPKPGIKIPNYARKAVAKRGVKK